MNKQKIEDLKHILQYPRLYLANYFEQFRNRIDLLAVQRCLNEDNKEFKKLLNKNWVLIIEKINLFELKCFQKVKTNKFNKDLTEETLEIIKQAEKNDQEQQNLDNQIKKLETFLFQNQTLLFLEKKDCNLIDLFTKMDMATSFGKLIIIKNKFFSKSDLQFLSNDYINSFISYSTVTNDLIEKIVLEKNFQKIQTNNQIDEFNVDNFAIDRLEFNFKRVKEINETVFFGLINLTKISFKNNQISSLDPKIFNGLYNLKKIIMKQNRIKHLDSNLFKNLVNLAVIDFSYNKISHLDKKIFNDLSNLVFIDFKSNHLKLLDECIFIDLNILNTVNLSHNELGYLDRNKFKGISHNTVIYF
jgi:Leucine-rich repeat (LRR) protein